MRYADDIVVGFEHEAHERHFWDVMRKRFEQFVFELHGDKTRLLEFDRVAAEPRQRRGLGKPETFTFLGFVFICGKSQRGAFQLQRKTRGDRMRTKLQGIAAKLGECIHDATPGTEPMAEGGGHGLIRTLRGAHELAGPRGVPVSRNLPMAAYATAAQLEGRTDVGADDEERCGMAAKISNSSFVAGTAVRCQTLEMGAWRANRARWDLCGERSVMGVPTGIVYVSRVFVRPGFTVKLNVTADSILRGAISLDTSGQQ